MSTPGPGGPPPYGQQPGPPWGPPPYGPPPQYGPPSGQYPQPPQRPARNPALPLIAGLVALIAVLVVASAFLLDGGVGGGDPQVGDCVAPHGTGFEQVDCDDDAAQARIIGTDQDMTGAEFDAADVDALCTRFPTATLVLWSGTSQDEEGAVLCAVEQ